MRIFSKQLLLHLGTLIISFTILALVLTQGIRGILTEQKVDELTRLAQRLAFSMENFAQYGIFNFQLLNTEIVNIHRYTDATIMIIDQDFNDVFAYGLGDNSIARLYITELAPLMDGEVISVFGTYSHPALTPLLVVGHPFWFDGEVAGAALVGFSMADLDMAVFAMYRMAIVALAVAGAFAFILIYISSRAISKPLSQLSQAAGVIAQGKHNIPLPLDRKDEIGQLATAFNHMATTLATQERVRREFTANLSHDMRSPLTSMHGFLTAITDGTLPPEKHDHYLNIVKQESERLIKLSNNILDIHRIEEVSANPTIASFNINDLIRRVVLSFQQAAIDKNIIITSHFENTEDYVLADEEKIGRVIYNLLDNAIKFTPASTSGHITVETTAETGAKKLHVQVRDTGQGIDKEDLKHIFDRFYKGDTTRNMDKLGSGLGLSIVKEFILAHNERIEVDSEYGKGTQFVFSLKRA